MEENRNNQPNTEVRDRPEAERDLDNRPGEQASDRETPTTAIREELVALFAENEADTFRTQWINIQSKFVDDPRASVQQANELVARVLENVTAGFADRRDSLERQWNSGENISTEDLRVALKRYRSFFDRLLTLES